jgi:type IV pilus assembly protein PilP
MMLKTTRFLLLVLGLALVVACDDKPRPSSPPTPSPKAPVATPPSAARAPEATPAKPAIELTDKDFTEGATNRDPFRSFLAEFARPARRVSKQQRKVILPRYALDELRLIAVVSGGIRPRAMFRDPTGLGVTVKRGDYISKSAGKVKQILSDKVVVEIEEQSEDKSSLVDRVIDLHPKEEREEKDSVDAQPEEPKK